jgi:UrcA family protein
MAMRKAYSKRAIMAVVAISVSLGGLGYSQSASANSSHNSDEVYSAKVRISDLDLSTDQGAQELLARIHRAARDVCIRSYEVWSPYINLQSGYARCVKDASNRAVAQVNSPMVTAAYAGQKTDKTMQLAEAKTAP